MRIGLVSKWIASGQAVVTRQVRSALDELGHETFVLARPGSGPRAIAAGAADKVDPVWDQSGITEGSAHEMPASEYLAWAEANALDVALFDENYQFAEVRALRESGVLTVGRFVWEYFGDEHVAGARDAYSTIYSLHRGEAERYRSFGIESPFIPWGIHPELLAVGGDRLRGAEDEVRFYFPGSFLGRRKPVRKVVKAFRAAAGEHLRLVVSAQVTRGEEFLLEAAEGDSRIELALEDEPEAAHRARFASCDVLIAPTRWEGLGLPLYEATAFGMPIITNDKPPMSEVVRDGENGVLVPSIENGTARSGITAWDPDVPAMTAAIERLGDQAELERMREGVAAVREERDWSHTVEGYRKLLEN